MMKRNIPSFLIGLLCGAVLVGGSVAYATGIMATPSTHKVYVDGQYTPVDAYLINGNNYFKIRDIAEAVDFGVTWDGSVQIDTTKGYTEEKPLEEDVVIHTPTKPGDFTEISYILAEMINDYRKESGVETLAIDEDLMKAAEVRAIEIAATYCYDHVRPDGSNIHTVVNASGDFRIGENIGAKDLRSRPLEILPDLQFDGWKNSPGHNDNMLNKDCHSIGIGVARNDYGMHYVVMLIATGEYEIISIDNPILEK